MPKPLKSKVSNRKSVYNPVSKEFRDVTKYNKRKNIKISFPYTSESTQKPKVINVPKTDNIHSQPNNQQDPEIHLKESNNLYEFLFFN